jgi:DNA-binding response OmpR family regulator
MKIHIIEDNADLQTIYKQLFTDAGHEAVTSGNGLTGITEVVDFQPDIVLLDIMMPEMDGYEFLRVLRENTSMHPMIIVCSNLSSQDDIDQAIHAGADAYLKKSDFIGAQLVAAVEQAYLKYQTQPPTA